MSFPETTVDEYGRIYCKAHHLETCPYCCMSFESVNEEIDATPSDRDIGVFIPEHDLLDWFDKMKKKIPRAFSPDDTLFGDDAGQHPYGTKLRTYFDEDPEQPMECYVLGSKWQMEDCCYPGIPTIFADGREPVYAVLMNGQPTQIHLTDAHEGEGGWMVDNKRPKKENGTIINERLDMLARLNGSHQITTSENSEDDYGADDGSDSNADMSLEIQNARIKRALKTISTSESMDQWNRKEYDKFIEEFLLYSFTPYERGVILKHQGGSKSAENGSRALEDAIKSFSSSVDKAKLADNNFYARIALAKMAIYHAKENLGGVILANKRGTKYQAIEFINFCAADQIPCISIQYAVDPESIEGPEHFLMGETYENMEEENSVAVCLEEHFLDYLKNEGTNDLGSGLLFYQGYLAPMKLMPLHAEGKSDSTMQQAELPDVNFGVELEMSCASGNRTEKMASNLAKHADVEIKLRQSETKCKGGFWPYGIGRGKSDSDSDDNSVGNSSCSSHASMPGLDPLPQHHAGSNHTSGESKTDDNPSGSAVCEKDSKKASKHTKWSICYDKSLKPNDDNPLSTMLELVSPILTGETGLKDLNHTVSVMSDIVCVRLNKTMGLHVHVEAKESQYSLENMISICQQFVIYEEIIDKFLNQSRRSGSQESHSYFRSNRISIMSRCETFKGSLDMLASCETRDELYDLMNSGDRARYHKLNLQNLKSGRQPTIEYRQHHASKDTTEIDNWVRFCILFTSNSALISPERNKKDSAEATFETLFADIIRCPVLREYYSTKQ